MEHIELYHTPDYRFLFSFKNRPRLKKLDVEKLKTALFYLESKQREVKRGLYNDTRSIESLIKYLKKDMIEGFYLFHYDPKIKREIKNTDSFINNVKNIIEKNT